MNYSSWHHPLVQLLFSVFSESGVDLSTLVRRLPPLEWSVGVRMPDFLITI